MRHEPKELQPNRERCPLRRNGAHRSAGRVAVTLLLTAAVMVGGLFLLYVYVFRPVSPPASPVETEPPVFGKARFGMTLEEMKALYPEMEELKKGLGATVIEGRFIARQVLWKQKLPGLPEPTDIELRFWKNQLWVVIVYFGANDLDTVMKVLSERYGPPPGDPATPVWSGAKSTVILAAKARWYSMHDNAISKEAAAVVIEDLKRSLGQRAAAGRRTTGEGDQAVATAGSVLATPAATVTAGK
jgi:hypothetical protein